MPPLHQVAHEPTGVFFKIKLGLGPRCRDEPQHLLIQIPDHVGEFDHLVRQIQLGEVFQHKRPVVFSVDVQHGTFDLERGRGTREGSAPGRGTRPRG